VAVVLARRSASSRWWSAHSGRLDGSVSQVGVIIGDKSHARTGAGGQRGRGDP
jgi:hypothetical protein